jgi:AraC-like DNA-binding protein
MPALPTPLQAVHCRLLTADLFTIDTWWNFSLCNPYWRLYWNLDAGATVIGPARALPLLPQRVYLLPAWVRTSGHCQNPVRHFFAHFEPLGLDGAWASSCFDQPLALPDDPVLAGLMGRLMGVWPGPTSGLWVQAAVNAAVAAAIAGLPAEALGRLQRHLAGAGVLLPALRWIDEHLRDPLPVKALAAHCGLSTHHFSRLFSARMGSSPSRYVQERRIALAAERLLDPSARIDQVATAVGFANRYHFTRVFIRRMGVAPAAYRRGANQGSDASAEERARSTRNR